MLGFFDVLDFASRVEREGPEDTAALYRALIDNTVKKEASRCVGAVSDGTGNRYLTLFSLDVKHAYFSDTIMLWAPLERVFADAFVNHCATFVCEALAMNVLIRGTLTLGEAVMDQASGTYIGMPIVEGARGEAIQEWLGVAYGDSATWNPFMAEVHPNLYIEYDIPVKQGKEAVLPPVALDWTRRWEEMQEISASRALAQLDQKTPHQKLKNAMAFARYCEENRDWHKRPPEAFEGKRLKMVKASSVTGGGSVGEKSTPHA